MVYWVTDMEGFLFREVVFCNNLVWCNQPLLNKYSSAFLYSLTPSPQTHICPIMTISKIRVPILPSKYGSVDAIKSRFKGGERRRRDRPFVSGG